MGKIMDTSLGSINWFWNLLLVHFNSFSPQNFPLTAMVMFALAIALIYQGRRAKISPDKTPY